MNWCPNCTTALSDAEVEHEERNDHLYHIRYPVKGSQEYLVVATTRPETMLGDSGVAVHPDDKRYQHLVGKMAILPLVGREIPIIADEYVEKDFGTGCVKMTPAHDPNDFEVGLRHNLEQILVLDDNGKVNANGGKYEGLDRYEARKVILEDLKKLSLLEGIEDLKHNVGSCYRCKSIVEPIISAQWFVKMKPLAKDAIRVVQDGEIKFVPDRFSKIYTNWMENVHDWCISRQLWWGHRIPRGTARTAATSMSPAKTRRSVKNAAARTSSRTKTCLTPGFPPRSGRFRPWVGRRRRRNSSISIPPTCSSRATISSSSGSRV